MKLKKGISLIILVVTIIVIIILAGSIILSLSQNNPIKSAEEATFRSNLDVISSKLNLYISDQYSNTLGKFDVSTMTGNLSTFVSDAVNYDSEYSVVCGKLLYKGTDDSKIQIAKDMGVIAGVVTINGVAVNSPDISYLPESTTQAITYDGSGNPVAMALSVAKTDTTWYDYSTTNKKWANIKTSNSGNEVYWVWIPRYAYRILYFDSVANRNTYAMNGTVTGLLGYSNSKGVVKADGVTIDTTFKRLYGAIDIKFLAGTTNVVADGTALPNDYIVHPAFTFGGKNLPGIWSAKYEASSSNPGATYGGDNVTTLQVRVLPGITSWRNIQVGNIQTVCMNMTNSNGSVGTTTSLDTHQMKNSEWGAVTYLAHSKYGKNGTEVAINSSSSYYTGGGTGLAYNTNVNQSTTGTVYGVYDLSGGAWEYTAAFLNNGNSYLGSYGTNKYFTSDTLNPEYTKYYDIYEPSDEEKQGGTFYGSTGIALWNSSSPYNVVDMAGEEANNIIRKRITYGTFAKFANTRGDGLFETSTTTSYYGKYTSGTAGSNWLISTTSSSGQPNTGWYNDYNLTGYAYYPWFGRGGYCDNGSSAGLFCSYATSGYAASYYSFRPVLACGVAL
jgi:hypothetical protein